MSQFKFASESPFWYFLARRAEREASVSLPPVLEGLNERALQLELPITYRPPHALAWAVVCLLFLVIHPRSEFLGRLGFSVMQRGIGRVLGPESFVETAFRRIIGNIENPAFEGRSPRDSVVDTFLANGLVRATQSLVLDDSAILTSCLQDRTMHRLGERACQARQDLWDETVAIYSARRPGWYRRNFADPHSWLFP